MRQTSSWLRRCFESFLVEAPESPVQGVVAPVNGVLLVLKSPVDVVEAPVGVALLLDEPPVDGVETPLLCLRSRRWIRAARADDEDAGPGQAGIVRGGCARGSGFQAVSWCCLT